MHVLQLFITQPIHHPQQQGAEDDKVVPWPSFQTTGTGRTEYFLKDWHERVPVSQFLQGSEKVEIFHLDTPEFHQKGIIFCVWQVNYEKGMKCQPLRANLKKKYGETN